MLKQTRHNLATNFTEDILFAISNGKFLTLRNTSLTLVLHSLTGTKLSMQCLHREGNCLSPDMIARIENVQAPVAQRCIKSTQWLGYQFNGKSKCSRPVKLLWDTFYRKTFILRKKFHSQHSKRFVPGNDQWISFYGREKSVQSPTDVSSQYLAMKYQMHPRSIQNTIHL